MLAWVYTESVTSRRFIACPGIHPKRRQGLAMTDTVIISSDRIGADTEVLTLDGKCDLLAAVAAERRIASALAVGATHIIFDLRGVTSLSAPMLQMLFRGLIQVRAENGCLVLVRPNAFVWDLFEQNGMDRGFASSPDLKGALAEAAA